MRRYLLPKEGNFYKANLHMHTTVSDGKMTPQETKKAFMEKGYSIVAFTDHEIMVPHLELTDDNFLAITSTEVSVNNRRDCPFMFVKTYHLNFYSEEPLKNVYSCFDKNRFWIESSKNFIAKEQFDYQYGRVYSVDCVQDMIRIANDEECLVSLNHPVWSLQNYADYIDLKGLWAIEWHNSASANMGYVDTIQPIDDLLRNGEQVFPIATDDAHRIEDCFGGFVMVKSPSLQYHEVYEALKNGDFYSSQNPLINELYIEDGIIYIRTSEVKKIFLTTDRRFTCQLEADEGEYLTSASFDINPYLESCGKVNNEYIRITVIDDNGKIAYTRAYFFEELC